MCPTRSDARVQPNLHLTSLASRPRSYTHLIYSNVLLGLATHDDATGGCPHGKKVWRCVVCSGCPHGKQKHNCAECSGCPHGKRKSRCVQCVGCPHGRLKCMGTERTGNPSQGPLSKLDAIKTSYQLLTLSHKIALL
eukprot:3126655-Amphidinium_carterae.1